jgi:UDPglucose--hexose-1-phosphate uridylyltransferase
MSSPEMLQYPHRRLNPLTGEWVLVSPHRNRRPWQGQVERAIQAKSVAYDPNCYLCPGNTRAGGDRNPEYPSTYVFTNDFAALTPDTPEFHQDDAGLLLAESESGTCRVVCFAPRHDLTLARMPVSQILDVVNVWAQQFQELGARREIQYVQIFENRGEVMGCSNPHPHGQIWANGTVPNEPAKEQSAQQKYLADRHSCMLCDYLAIELRSPERVVYQNGGFVALVPFWAVWPYEILVLPREHVRDLVQLGDSSRHQLADVLKKVTTRYDNLFQTSFPYSMGFHQAPTDEVPHPEWHLHAHFFPPLLRSATVRKFMVGYEMLASPQRDLTPELAASQLKALSDIHFLDSR